MASNAIRTQGTIIEYLETGPSTYAAIGEIISFDGPGGKATIIDTTNLQSVAKEKLPGLPDEGSFSLTCNFAGKDTGQQAMQAARAAQTIQTLKVTFVDGSIATFTAYCLEYKISAKADSKVELAITLEITGAVEWTWGTLMMTADEKAKYDAAVAAKAAAAEQAKAGATAELPMAA
jgi:hypothetical protein